MHTTTCVYQTSTNKVLTFTFFILLENLQTKTSSFWRVLARSYSFLVIGGVANALLLLSALCKIKKQINVFNLKKETEYFHILGLHG